MDEEKQRLQKLLERLQGNKTLRWIASELKLGSQSTIHRWRNTGIISAEGKISIARYLGRSIEDIDSYLSGRVGLDDLLDPKRRFEHLTKLTRDDVLYWLRWRASLRDKVQVAQELNTLLYNLLIDRKAESLGKSINAVIQSGRYPSLEAIAQMVGISSQRLNNLITGEESPTEDDLIALSGVLDCDTQQLLKDYLAGS
ncbi:helix-turn-helix domain-containing protein [Nostoc sp. CCY 9925]|uniref:helix-turn-helix domain-containing protein n=1 Tax=Nostoc sp. CCY 9925 TaxID=3103865 RepID=UPI0039C71E5D